MWSGAIDAPLTYREQQTELSTPSWADEAIPPLYGTSYLVIAYWPLITALYRSYATVKWKDHSLFPNFPNKLAGHFYFHLNAHAP